MTAYEFIGKLLMDIPSNNYQTPFTMEYVYDTHINIPQWINTKYCKVKNGKLILGVSIVDDDPEENYIDTLPKLKQYFLTNGVKRSYRVYISSESGEYQILDFDIKMRRTSNEYRIICRAFDE